MKPRVIFPDVFTASLSILRADSLLDGVTFGTVAYDVAADPVMALPYVALSVDANFGRYPVVESPRLRVRVWAATPDQALLLAQKVRAVLLSYAGDEQVRSFGELTDPVPTTDPDSGGPLAFFTVAARLRPIPL